MKIRLRTVGLDAQAEQRTRLASQLLAAYGFRVQVRIWDDSDCHVLLVNNGDARSQQCAKLARERGVAVLTLLNRGGWSAGIEGPFIAAEGTAATLASALQRLLSNLQVTSSSVGTTEVRQGSSTDFRDERRARPRCGTDSALVRIALDPGLRGRDVHATVRGRTIGIHPFSGRVSAASLSDLLLARDMLAEPGWHLDLSPPGTGSTPAGEVCSSIDAFYVLGALRVKDVLPAFPNDEMELSNWPDLGAAPEAVVALRVARALSKQGAAWRALAQSAGLPAAEVNACLWAFSASSLLTANRTSAPPVVTSRSHRRVGSTVLAKLAERFGLARRAV